MRLNFNSFLWSPFGIAIAKIDVQNVLTALEAPAESIQKTEDWMARLQNSIDSPWFDALFGHRVTLALLPIAIRDLDQPSREELSQALVFVLEPEHPAKFLDLMKHFVATDIDVASENYDQGTVNRFELETGGTVHYSIAGGLVVFSLHRLPVLRCLDTLTDPAASLAQNPDYQAVERELADNPAPQVYGYANLVQFYEMVLDMAAENAADRPELGIFIQSGHPEIMERIIQQTAAAGQMPLMTETYGPHRISYLQLPFGSDLSPAYAYINGYCIVAVNTGIMKSYIDTFASGQNITGSDAFIAVDKGLSEPNNQLAYIKFDRLLDKVPEIIQWGASMAAMAQPDKAGRIAPLAEQVINPLADGLKMYKTIGVRTFFAEAKIESQSYTDVER